MYFLIVKFICIILLILFATLIWILVQESDYVESGDIALVLGCKINGCFIRGRIELATELYKNGKVKTVIATGKGNDDIPEYFWIYKELKLSLVREEDIYLEKRAMNTLENLAYSKDLITDIKDKRVIVCTNKFHIARVKLISKALGLNVSVLTKACKVSFYLYIRETLAFIKDFIKIKIHKM